MSTDFMFNVFMEKDTKMLEISCDANTTFQKALMPFLRDVGELDRPEMQFLIVENSVPFFPKLDVPQHVVNLGSLRELKDARLKRKISTCFKALDEDKLHLIVRGGGPLALNVFLTQSQVVHTIDIPLTARVKDLKDYLEDIEIHAVYQPRQSIPISNVRDVVAMLGSLSDSCEMVIKSTLIRDLFPAVFSRGDIQLLIEGVEFILCTPGLIMLDHSVSVHEESLDQVPPLQTFKGAIHSKVLTHSKAPSSEGMPDKFEKRQTYELSRVYCGRPRATHKAIPPVLLNPVLCKFAYDLHFCEPDTQDIQCYNTLVESQSNFYETEWERTESFNDTLQYHGIVPLIATQVPGHGSRVDGAFTIPYRIGGVVLKCLVVNFEGKLEMGSTGAEPFLQNIQYWMQHVEHYLTTESKIKDMDFKTNFPVLLILLMGPYLGVAVGAFQAYGAASVQILHPIVPLYSHPTDEDTGRAGERMICAIRKATVGLTNHYNEIHQPNPPVCQLEFPFPSTFQANDQVVKFKYDRAVDSDKRIFQAHKSSDPKQKYCVKFTRRYGNAVHQFAMSGSFSPDLYAVDEFYDWKMVVMDDISEDYQDLHSSPPEDREEVQRLLVELLKKLHEAGFVHGDIRDVNIMWKMHEGKIILKLVDFDWAGRIGEAKYPHRINCRDITRPDGVVPGGLIQPEHDLYMAKQVLAVMVRPGSDPVQTPTT